MLPLAAFEVKRFLSKGILCSILSMATISFASFYGVQDPTLAANTYGNYVGWADRTSWYIGLSFAPRLNFDILSWIDPRVGAPISALAPPTDTPSSSQQLLVIIGTDSVGLRATYKDPRNEDFFRRHLNIDPRNLLYYLDRFDVVYSGGSYRGILKP